MGKGAYGRVTVNNAVIDQAMLDLDMFVNTGIVYFSIGTDDGTCPDDGVTRDGRIGIDDDPFFDDHVMTDCDGLGVDHGDTGQHVVAVDVLTQIFFSHRDLIKVVDTHHHVGTSDDKGTDLVVMTHQGDDISQIILAFTLVPGHSLQDVEEMLVIDDIDTRIDFLDLFLDVVAITIFDNRVDVAILVPDNPAIAFGIVKHHRDNREVIAHFLMGIQDLVDQSDIHQWHVTRQDEDNTFLAFQQGCGRHGGMPCPKLFFLDGILDPFLQDVLQDFLLVSDHDNGLINHASLNLFDDVFNDGFLQDGISTFG